MNISSTAGLVADATEPSAHYNASKAGVLALTRQMAVEWASHGIRANAVCPGVIDTPMLRLMDDPADVLVNAAGIYRVAPLLKLLPEEWDDVLAVNLRGSVLAGRAMAAALIDKGMPGAIVNISSTAGLVADATEPSAHYNASKAGVLALTRQMAVEWAPHGIRANAVCPGVIDTPMLRLMEDPAAGRLGTPDEVAAAITFLASDDASYLTGVALPVDGGITAI